MDVGQPKDYLTGMGLYLNYVRHSTPDRLSRENGVVGNVLLVKIIFSPNQFDSELLFNRIQQRKSVNVVVLVRM